MNTSEIGWEFFADGGTVYLDNLYWDAGYHQETNRGFDNEQAARMEQFGTTLTTPTDPGIISSINKVFVVSQTHADIGFDYPPEDMRQKNKEWLDAQIAYARTHTGFRYTIEHTWMFENWRTRSTPAQISELVGLLRSGQFDLGAAHSTLHSGKAGVEQVNRLFWNAERARQVYQVPVNTVYFNDVPGVAWSYPQAMARSGLKYLVCGENMFIGGGFTQPYASFLFRWHGPDGSSVLTWSSQKSYIEGWHDYGIPFGSSGAVNKTKLTEGLKALTDAGYPYDAVLLEHSTDAGISQAEYAAATAWNVTYQNPQIITATAREFFQYMEGKYTAQIPARSGNWTTRWDTGQMVEPRAEKIVKNAQDLVPAIEKAWAIGNALGRESYPIRPVRHGVGHAADRERARRSRRMLGLLLDAGAGGRRQRAVLGLRAELRLCRQGDDGDGGRRASGGDDSAPTAIPSRSSIRSRGSVRTSCE